MIGKVLMIGFFLAMPAIDANDCIPKKFGYDSIVCVCNATYCDSTPDRVLENGHFHWYISSKSGHRLNHSSRKFSTKEIENGTIILVNNAVTYQKIVGWGGAFTDSAGINIKNLSLGSQDALMRSYFGEEGCRYNLGRVPIGSTDFSLRPYTYDDHSDDTELKYFALADEDFKYKIPLMQKAQTINPNVKFLGAVWTAPPWMKTNHYYYGYGSLSHQYYQVYADYYIKFFEAYDQCGIKFWAVSTGNAPSIQAKTRLSTGWTFRTIGRWIVNNLGPTLANSNYKDIIIIALDDQRTLLPEFIDDLFEEFPEAKKYVGGIALHSYLDPTITPDVLNETHQHHPDKFLFISESAQGNVNDQEDFIVHANVFFTGFNDTDYPKVKLGGWSRGERLVLDMIQNLNYWVAGWVDWNLALNEQGGPTNETALEAAIVVNSDRDEFYQQPMYYVMKHFSRFVPPGSMKIHIEGGNISSTAFETPNREIVIVLYNESEEQQNVTIKDSQRAEVMINLEIPMRSLNTIIYK